MGAWTPELLPEAGDSQHHTYSASGSAGWMACPGKIAMERGLKNESSSFADEGSAAHFLAAECLTKNLNPFDFRGRYIVCWEKEGDKDGQCWSEESVPYGAKERSRWEVSSDMAENMSLYCDRVREIAKGHTLLVEQRVEFGPLIGLEGAFGTSDVIVIAKDGSWIEIDDLKYGFKAVYATNNPQMQLYTLGVLNDFEHLIDASKLREIRMRILQPRIHNFSDWATDLNGISEFADRAQQAIELSEEAIATWPAAKMSESGINYWYDKYLNPTAKGCEWCLAKADCPALLKANLVEVAHLLPATVDGLPEYFDDQMPVDAVVEQLPPETLIEEGMKRIPHISFAELERLYKAIPMMETWIEAVQARMFHDMMQGYKAGGYKLVKGKAGHRKWADKQVVETLAKDTMRLKTDELYDKEIKSPTALEKVLKTRPRLWKKLESHIVRSEAKISVAPMDDKRESLDPYNEKLNALPEYDEEVSVKTILRDFGPTIQAAIEKLGGKLPPDTENDFSDLC